MDGGSDNWTALGAAMAGLATGIGAVFGFRKSGEKGDAMEVAELNSKITAQNERIARLEAKMESNNEQLRDLREESRMRDEKIFDKLDKLNSELSRIQGGQA